MFAEEKKSGIDIANLPADCPVRFSKSEKPGGSDTTETKEIVFFLKKIRSVNVGGRREE